MDALITKDIKNMIKETLGSEEQQINEALMSQVKKFTINTDLLSDDNIQNHFELYQAYVDNFNKVSAKLDAVNRAEANSSHSDYSHLKNDETYNMNGAYLHELYFSNIGDVNSQIKMDSLSYMRLARDFGSFDNWQKDFIACCLASKCGWAVTYLNTYTQTYMNCSIDLHSKNVPFGGYPVIVMDVWQHAYYRDYLKDVKTYTYAMMKQLRWPVIEKRIQKADKILQIVRGQ